MLCEANKAALYINISYLYVVRDILCAVSPVLMTSVSAAVS